MQEAFPVHLQPTARMHLPLQRPLLPGPCAMLRLSSGSQVDPTASHFQSHSPRLSLVILFPRKPFQLIQAEVPPPSSRFPLPTFLVDLASALVILYCTLWIYVLISLTACLFQLRGCVVFVFVGLAPGTVPGMWQVVRKYLKEEQYFIGVISACVAQENSLTVFLPNSDLSHLIFILGPFFLAPS